MNIRIFLLTLILIAPAVLPAQTNDRARYVNYKYKAAVPSTLLPNGVKHLGGALIGDIEADPVYGISQVERGRTKMLWLEASTGQDATGVTGWMVLDVISFPQTSTLDHIYIYGDPAVGCRRGGKEIENLVGIGRIVRRQRVFRPAKLWVASIATKRFEPVALDGVKCEYSEP